MDSEDLGILAQMTVLGTDTSMSRTRRTTKRNIAEDGKRHPNVASPSDDTTRNRIQRVEQTEHDDEHAKAKQSLAGRGPRLRFEHRIFAAHLGTPWAHAQLTADQQRRRPKKSLSVRLPLLFEPHLGTAAWTDESTNRDDVDQPCGCRGDHQQRRRQHRRIHHAMLDTVRELLKLERSLRQMGRKFG